MAVSRREEEEETASAGGGGGSKETVTSQQGQTEMEECHQTTDHAQPDGQEEQTSAT